MPNRVVGSSKVAGLKIAAASSVVAMAARKHAGWQLSKTLLSLPLSHYDFCYLSLSLKLYFNQILLNQIASAFFIWNRRLISISVPSPSVPRTTVDLSHTLQ